MSIKVLIWMPTFSPLSFHSSIFSTCFKFELWPLNSNLWLLKPSLISTLWDTLYIRGTITNLHLLQILPKLKHLAVHGLNSLSTVELPQITELSIYNQVTAENLSTTIERVFRCLQTFRFYPALESQTSFLKTKFQLPRSCKNIETSQSQLEMFTLAKDFEELSLTIMENRFDRTVEVNRVREFSHNLVSLQLRYGYDETIDKLFNHLLELAHHLPKLRKLSVNAFNIWTRIFLKTFQLLKKDLRQNHQPLRSLAIKHFQF